ncbi:hypothetical protein G6F35_018147 [Rhizopus arrhizus]|nr:hypothetical protein G6F40_017109 [Rhizopus arrhizus]KAG1166511.1 hypothetical protein G6F35_018147 [Rhizopus arrhizus]
MNSTTGENSFSNGAAPNGDNMSIVTGSIDLSSFAGSSPLTNDGTSMVLDSLLLPSSSTVNLMACWKRLRRLGLLVMRQLPIKRFSRWIVPSAG